MYLHEIKKILVPIDFSLVSLNALQIAIAICKRQLATLTLIHVIEIPFVQWPRTLRERLDHLGRQAKESRLNHDLVINHIVKAGDPADQICRWALERDFDLIVMGTEDTSVHHALNTALSAIRVIWNSPCPVMTIPGSCQWFDFKKILFPVRMVPHALDKYDYIRTIIFKNNSSLVVAGLINKSESHQLAEMVKLLESLQYKIEADAVPSKTIMQHCDHVAREVLSLSQSENPDLIVITATLDTPIKEFFQGPFIRDIVNYAGVPVLSIRHFTDPTPLKGFHSTSRSTNIL